MHDNDAEFVRVKQRLEGLLSNMKEDLEFAGDQAARAIVQTTLAGIGENDQPFAPYSPAYKAVIDSVGGKPGQVVNLRGLFYHEGQKRSRSKKDKGQGRRGKLGVRFHSMQSGPFGGGVVRFRARTAETRPMRGLTDPLSEMSLDLIKVEATDTTLKLIYEPRAHDYMIAHQEGRGRLPQRKWFTAGKAAVKAAVIETLRNAIHARVVRFNTGGSA